MEDQITWHDLDSSFGRMCQELSQATEGKTSPQSLKKRSGSSSRKPPLCLCLRRDGQSPDSSAMNWEPGALLGEYTMHSFGESPREENASLLSQILENSPHPKYYLSEKACLGILTRAERRGKELPPELKEALLTQSRSRSEAENLGGGKGILIQEERTGALSTLNNQSVLCFEPRSPDGVPRISECGVVPTLNTAQGGQRQPCVAVGFAQRGFGDYKPGEVASSLKRRDYKDATTLVAGLDCRNGRENGDLCGTLQSKPNGGFFYNCTHPVRVGRVVRRLTPLECERLQGYPDGWTDIGPWTDSKGKLHKESSDTARYKALGNSIALPFWFWLMRRISAQYERPAYLGSLFDGIGGFPLCWERCNGPGTALWASEIEEFPMAVTKVRFR